MSYLINNKTEAIMHVNRKLTKIYEEKNTFLLEINIRQLLNINCFLSGTTMEGALNYSAKFLGTTYKVPIIIKDIPLMPTHSPRNKNCIYINVNKILTYEPTDTGSLIIFKSGNKLPISTNYSKLDVQILRTTRLIRILDFEKGKKSEKHF